MGGGGARSWDVPQTAAEDPGGQERAGLPDPPPRSPARVNAVTTDSIPTARGGRSTGPRTVAGGL